MPGDENAAQNAAPDAAQTNNKPPGLSKPKATEDSEYRALIARHADLKSLLEVGGLLARDRSALCTRPAGAMAGGASQW